MTIISTEEDLEAWEDSGPEEPFYVASSRNGLVWVIYCTEDGDWYATRPALEDDEPSLVQGVTVSLGSLPLPIRIAPPPSVQRTVWDEVLAARAAARIKHGASSIEAMAATHPAWLPVFVEEVGEVAHEMTYDATGGLRAELIDVLSVASAWVDAIDRAALQAEARA